MTLLSIVICPIFLCEGIKTSRTALIRSTATQAMPCGHRNTAQLSAGHKNSHDKQYFPENSATSTQLAPLPCSVFVFVHSPNITSKSACLYPSGKCSNLYCILAGIPSTLLASQTQAFYLFTNQREFSSDVMSCIRA